MAVSPLNFQQIIVDEQGRPTPDFLRWWQSQRDENAKIVSLKTAEDISAVLDRVGNQQGALLYRTAGAWAILPPGPTGYVLKTRGESKTPVWAALSFLGLPDTPSTYQTQRGRMLVVRFQEDGLEFADVIDAFLSLTDTPSDYTGQAGKIVAVNAGEDALEFVDFPDTFLSLTDTPSDYTGQAGKIVAVNAGEDALEFINAPSGGGSAAVDVTYDNLTSGLTATNVQAALDELRALIGTLISVQADVATLNEYVILQLPPLRAEVVVLNKYAILQLPPLRADVATLNEYVILEV